MTLVTETVPETTQIERERTEIDYETTTREVEKVKCDCCEQRWDPEGEIETHEIVVGPSASVAVYENIISGDPDPAVERMRYNSEFGLDLTEQGLMKGLNECMDGFMIQWPNPNHRASEMSDGPVEHEMKVREVLSQAQDKRRSRETSLGKIPRWDYTFGFYIELPIDGEKKHLCEFCYGVIFNV